MDAGKKKLFYTSKASAPEPKAKEIMPTLNIPVSLFIENIVNQFSLIEGNGLRKTSSTSAKQSS